VRVTVTTTLPCTLDQARDQILTSRLMEHASWPLIMFTPLDPPALPAIWEPGNYRVQMRSLWVIPLGSQTIAVSFPPSSPGQVLVRDNGFGQLVRRWDHLITLDATTDGIQSRYTDQVDIDAGVLTIPVWAWANLWYRWRQHRMRRLAARNFHY